ncbi:TPR-like protein [Mycena sanguinolenta]|uniref:TPR-like protein n=1 Tax=Mycena sanguinolenta TaxID=230812 RepID=A0A8H7DII3_9AGAR|nr:TPR-like protein [Mycena sanguinolenta]
MVNPTDLKAQGNALFGAKIFAEAEKKYTLAIEATDEATASKELAVLYANRAACRLSLKRYMDADADAKKATDLDPTYAKAYARLATAQDRMGVFHLSKESWKHALDALPKGELKPEEQVQKTQYEASLEAATAALIKLQNTVVGDSAPNEGPFVMRGEGRMPWDLAAAIVPRLRTQRPTATSPELFSSAWVIKAAYEDFMNGVGLMKQLQVVGQGTHKRVVGMVGAILGLTNGIMRDSRVMHIPDNDFISKYNKQVAFEARGYKAWTEGGPEVVIQEALTRQRKDGWDATRPALSITVRYLNLEMFPAEFDKSISSAWIMRGILDSGVYQRHHVAVEFFRNCLTVIRTLREHWILESKEDRGAIFEKSFEFGVQQLYLEALMKSYSDEDGSMEVLEDLFKESDLLIHEIDEVLRQPRSTEPVDPGFVSSFYIYPKGEAYAMKGFYYNKRAMKSGNDQDLFHKSALEYMSAAKSFPQDDEKHPWYLHAAFGSMMNSHAFPLRETLDVMKQIREAVPKANEIWERSALSACGVMGIYRNTAKKEQQLRDMVVAGKASLDDRMGIEYH